MRARLGPHPIVMQVAVHEADFRAAPPVPSRYSSVGAETSRAVTSVAPCSSALNATLPLTAHIAHIDKGPAGGELVDQRVEWAEAAERQQHPAPSRARQSQGRSIMSPRSSAE